LAFRAAEQLVREGPAEDVLQYWVIGSRRDRLAAEGR
jgi:hypothetical protein